MKQMNKWQQHYIETVYNGKMPRNEEGKLELELLGFPKDFIRVTFKSGKTETFEIVLEDGNMDDGYIDVRTLASNMSLWYSRRLKMVTGNITKE